jgi:hypothetical protein
LRKSSRINLRSANHIQGRTGRDMTTEYPELADLPAALRKRGVSSWERDGGRDGVSNENASDAARRSGGIAPAPESNYKRHGPPGLYVL